MQTDLLPKMELPYMAVITTEVGASPEKVESDVVKPMESTLCLLYTSVVFPVFLNQGW